MLIVINEIIFICKLYTMTATDVYYTERGIASFYGDIMSGVILHISTVIL